VRKPDGQSRVVLGRWVIDATGRRRILSKKLNLGEEVPNHVSSSWFRVKGKVSVTDMVEKSNVEWHTRCPGDHHRDPALNDRYYATNHISSEGYWLWLIPLKTGYTSVGIVADQNYHDFDTFNTLERAKSWIQKHEPQVFAKLKDSEVLDFAVRKNYSYGIKQFASEKRYAMTGEASFFIDPLFSPGSDAISYTNTIICEMINLDQQDALKAETVKKMNDAFIDWSKDWRGSIHSLMPAFDNPSQFYLSWFWNMSWYIGFAGPYVSFGLHQYGLHKVIHNEELNMEYAKVRKLHHQMLGLFAEWTAKKQRGMSPKRTPVTTFVDFNKVPFFQKIARANSPPMGGPWTEGISGSGVPPQSDLVALMRNTVTFLEELSQIILRFAVREVLPEHAHKLEGKWLNPWVATLDPMAWEKDGLFKPMSPPRDVEALTEQVRAMVPG
jgi:hypothetical protein